MKYERFHIPGFGAGYRSDLPPNLIQPGEITIGSQNMNVELHTALKKRGGYVKFNTALDATYDETHALFTWPLGTGASNLFRIGYDSGASPTHKIEYCTGTYPQASWSTVAFTTAVFATASKCSIKTKHFNGEMYIASEGSAELLIITTSSPTVDGDFVNQTTPAVGAGTITYPSCLEVYFDRLWMTRANGRRIYYSNHLDGRNWTVTTDFLDIPTSGYITELRRLRDKVIIFTTSGIWKMSGGDDVIGSLYTEELSRNNDCLGPHSVVEANGLLYWYGSGGFYVTDGNTIKCISDQIPLEVSKINKTYNKYVNGVFDQARNQIAWFIPYDTATNCNYALVFDLNLKIWNPPYTGQYFNSSTVIPGYAGLSPVIVGAGVKSSTNIHVMRLWNSADLTDNGDTIASKIMTGAISLGDETATKRVRLISLSYGELGVANALVYIKAYPTVGATGTGNNLGGFLTTATGSNSAPNWLWIKQIPNTPCVGEWFRFEIYDSSSVPFAMGALSILYVSKGRRR